MYPEILLRNISAFDLVPIFTKVLPATAIEIDKIQNSEIVASALTVVLAIEDKLYEFKYLGKSDTFFAIQSLVGTMFGGLNCKRLYENIVAGLENDDLRCIAIEILTNLWKMWDTRVQNNRAHKEIAESVISGLGSVIKVLPSKSNKRLSFTVYLGKVLSFVRVVETGMSRLEFHKKDLGITSHAEFATYLDSVKKGPYAAHYAQMR